MRLSIRLQQHGKKNHPYWWIVVAPQHHNIFGRYTEHIGYWSPRHNINIKRQIIFNIPRLMYWLANGAVPTPKIHRFLTMFNILPQQWYYQKSAQEKAAIQAKKKPYEQMTPKQKSLEDRRRKRNQRQQLARFQYHRYQARAYRRNKIHQKLMAKLHATQFQNSVIRDALMQADLQKYDRISQLANDKMAGKPIDQKLQQIKQKLQKAKSQLAFIQKQYSTSHILQKSNISKNINTLINQLNILEMQQYQQHLPQNIQNNEQYITQNYLDRKLKYELVTKRLQKSQKQLAQINTFMDIITLDELYNKLKEIKQKGSKILEQLQNDQDIMQLAKQIFKERTQNFAPMTRLDLIAFQQDKQTSKIYFGSQDQRYSPDSHMLTKPANYINMLLDQNAILPTTNPVHPRPDLKSYIPQEHYDPIDYTKLNVLLMDSLEPQEQLQKYHRKRNPGETLEERKNRDHRRRMERLRMVTDH